MIAEMTDADALRSQAREALLFTIRGGLRIVGGMVEMAAGVTTLFIDMTVKAIEAAEEAIEAADDDDDQETSAPMPKSTSKPKAAPPSP